MIKETIIVMVITILIIRTMKVGNNGKKNNKINQRQK